MATGRRSGVSIGVLALVVAACAGPGPSRAAPAPTLENQRRARLEAGLSRSTFALPDGAALGVERRGAPARWVLVGASWLVPDVLDALGDRPLAALEGRARLGFPPAPRTTHLEQDAADLAAWLAAERAAGAPPLVLLGQGYHAMVAALAAARAPEHVAALALVAPLPRRRDPWFDELAATARGRGDLASHATRTARLDATGDERLAAEVERLLLEPRFADPSLASLVRADPLVAADGGVGALAAQADRAVEELGAYDVASELARVRCPAFVLHGAGDSLPAAASRELADALPHGRCTVVERSGAFPWIEAPAAFAAWLDEVDAAAREGS